MPLLLVFLMACLKDEPFKREYNGYAPVKRDDGLSISDPENQNMDRELLEKAYQLIYQDDRFVMARSLLVFRNGKLVAEAYPNNPEDVDNIYNIQSCTKSITSIVTGIAMHKNLIDSPDELLYDVFPEHFDSDARKRAITLHDALTMKTGLEFDNSKHTLEMYQYGGNSAQYVLSQQYLYPPGLVMNYNDGAPQLVSRFIEKKTGKTLSDFAREFLFKPLNISHWKWEAAKDGSAFGAFSLFLKPRDLGKIGLLLQQVGAWDDTRILDSDYLSLATSIHGSESMMPYGYYFWILPAYNAYAAMGHGGQFVLVAPEKQLVVVYTAWPYTSSRFWDRSDELISLIIESCK